ncbi:cysteine hydrolase [Herbaspirillum sp. LeCh32-8]|uniref:cysteine hydrolase n=1 Tax=Herbaspirillum sp. LeCh32-8 TaxID=2821356 RepID=UPI001AE7A97A|nr:cysteine hydrolase [Herbaspirillum sp. LeCh32-8]MBP0598125.1 cysteine hydrolase [Herbaspirillum sp. LeCh32-8]
MPRKRHLLVIDPQNDFCDLPPAYLPIDPAHGQPHAPALPVAGAHADMRRVAQLIDAGGAAWSAISVTLDSHHRLDIAHPTFWRRGDGAAVAPFTQIEAAQVRAGQFLPRDPQALARTLNYLDALETSDRYRLMVWPVHCEIGSWGGDVHADVRAAYNRWEDATLGVVAKLRKGSNPWTEHYSAVQAEVPDAADPDTQLNLPFIHTLAQADAVYITGEAGSHCVRATTEHIAQNLDAAGRARLVLVTDCMSPVAGFEQQHRDFLTAMQTQGLRLASAQQVLQELLAAD